MSERVGAGIAATMIAFLAVVLLTHTPEPMNGTYHLIEGEVDGIEISGLELTITDTVVWGEGPCNLFSYTKGKGKNLFRTLAACIPDEGTVLVDEDLFLDAVSSPPSISEDRWTLVFETDSARLVYQFSYDGETIE